MFLSITSIILSGETMVASVLLGARDQDIRGAEARQGDIGFTDAPVAS